MLAILQCSARNDFVVILDHDSVVDLCSRMSTRVKINLLPGPIPVQFEKKTLNLTRGDSPTGQAHYDKGVGGANATVAME